MSFVTMYKAFQKGDDVMDWTCEVCTFPTVVYHCSRPLGHSTATCSLELTLIFYWCVTMLQMSNVFDMGEVMDMKQNLKQAVVSAMLTGSVDRTLCQLSVGFDRESYQDTNDGCVVKDKSDVRGSEGNHCNVEVDDGPEGIVLIDE